MKHKWCVQNRPDDRMYAQSNMKCGGTWERVLLHRFLLGAEPRQQVDHKNNDGLDCTRTNLRVATHGQNMHNQGSRGGSSKFKGVSRHKKSGKWIAQIMADRRPRYLGLFENEVQAAKAYDDAAIKLHGEFARTNFPATTNT